ncbi:hypothetical protein GW17_00025360 [Ensete ventricosum]|nr:hypothetical protein GW17_00025360 [Ensete ventricosum]RZR92890.1 hypothetical protein BHM03_00021266 [Ensete ventricosum]
MPRPYPTESSFGSGSSPTNDSIIGAEDSGEEMTRGWGGDTDCSEVASIGRPRDNPNEVARKVWPKSSPGIGRSEDDVVGNSPRVHQKLDEGIGSLLRWRKGVRRKKIETHRKIIEGSRKACRELGRSSSGFIGYVDCN